jgi:hypothetical protein
MDIKKAFLSRERLLAYIIYFLSHESWYGITSTITITDTIDRMLIIKYNFNALLSFLKIGLKCLINNFNFKGIQLKFKEKSRFVKNKYIIIIIFLEFS